jgi:hypothetical protein
MTDVVIVSAARTAVGKFGGSLAKVAAPESGRHGDSRPARAFEASSRADQRSDPRPGAAAGTGQNPARQALIKAGLPNAVPGMTINKVCGSGLKAVMLAAKAIRRRRRDRDRRRPGKHERCRRTCCRARATARMGDCEAGRHDDRRRPVGRLQPVPHGHHGRERGQGIRHYARAAGCALPTLSQNKAGGAGSRPLQRRDRAVRDSAEERAIRCVFATDEFIATA